MHWLPTKLAHEGVESISFFEKFIFLGLRSVRIEVDLIYPVPVAALF